MCRNIKVLFNFDPPASKQEIKDASTQFVRKISGFNNPSKINEEIFNKAVEDISKDVQVLLDSLVTSSTHKNREQEALIAKQKAHKRFGTRK